VTNDDVADVVEQALVLRALPRLTASFRDLFVRTLLTHCAAVIRRDAHDQFLVRFLPALSDAFAACRRLQQLADLAALLDAAGAKQAPFAHVVTTKASLQKSSHSLVLVLPFSPNNSFHQFSCRATAIWFWKD